MSHQRTIYVVDADPASRRVVAAQLARIGAEAWPIEGGAEFLVMLDHLMPACTLIDMESPGALEILAEIRRRQPGWLVLAMGEAPEVQVVVETMKLGALDFLTKPFDDATLATALLPAFARLESAIEAGETRRHADDRLSHLSPRERDVALALFGGQSNKSVAHLFGISVRTVEMHRAHIMAKLEVKTLAEAAVLATRAGLAASASDAPPRTVTDISSFLPRRRLARS